MQRTLLITGCSSGIGYDAAHGMAAHGWTVIASARKAEDVVRLRSEGLTAVRIDYEDPATIASGFEAAMELTGGRLNALFNNGAWAVPGALEDIPADALRANLEANLVGWHDLTRLVIKVMRQQGAGRIVNCSSVLGLVAAPWRGPYVASKFALEGYSDCLRMEMDGSGIDIVLIEPGPITTPFRQNAIAQFERWVDWEASARAPEYRDSLLEKLYKGSGGGRSWPASAVTDALARALDARRPKARYYVTRPTYMAAILRRTFPARLADRILRHS